MRIDIKTTQKYIGLHLTSTRCSGATETWFASTCETSICVDAVGIGMAIMGVSSAFIYILWYTKCFEIEKWDNNLYQNKSKGL